MNQFLQKETKQKERDIGEADIFVLPTYLLHLAVPGSSILWFLNHLLFSSYYIWSWERWDCFWVKVVPPKHNVSVCLSWRCMLLVHQTLHSSLWNKYQVKTCVCAWMNVCIFVCVCRLVSVSHLESLACQLKEGKGKDWSCRKRRQLLAFLNTVEIFIRLLFLALSFHSISRHLLCTIRKNPVVLPGSPGARWGKEFCLVIYEAIRCWLFICAS